MKLSTLTLAASLVATGAFAAEPVAPADVVYTDGAIEASLTGTPGNPEEGEKVFTSRAIGNCVACHEVTSLSAAFPGNVGPMLDGVGSRWNEAETARHRGQCQDHVDGTVMPSFYRWTGSSVPVTDIPARQPRRSSRSCSAQQVEDVVAFLMTLKDE